MATLLDVSSKAGVSIATVSRTINKPSSVTPMTRHKVQAAIDALGYRPSRVARRLRVEHGSTHILGVIIPDIQNPFFAELVRGIEDVAQTNGYTLILANVDEDPVRQSRCLETLRTESVDGVIFPPVTGENTSIRMLHEAGIPVVCVDRRMDTLECDTVVTDNIAGAKKAVTHLIQLGHRRIGYIGGMPIVSSSRERRMGYETALQEHGIPIDPDLICEGTRSKEQGRTLTHALMDISHPPTALLAGNNLMTLGVMATLRERQITIPEQVALVGYDDLPWNLALALNPPPTTVRQPTYQIGCRATRLLLSRIEEPQRPPTLVVLQPELKIRASCGSYITQ